MASMMEPPATLPSPAPAPRAEKIVIVSIVFMILTTIAVGLRFGGRWLKKVGLLPEDWIVLGGLIFQYGFFAITIAGVYAGGVGYHLVDVPVDLRLNNLKMTIAVQVLYTFAMGLMKVSVLVSLIRIFPVRSFRIVAWIVMGLVLCWAAAVILVTFLICTPVSYNWNTTTETGHCGDTGAAYLSISVVDVITDGFILLLPIPMVLRLQMPVSQKLGVLTIFGLGVLTLAIGIVRLLAIVNTNFADFTYSAVDVFIWAPLEPAMALLVACGVTLKPYLERIFPAMTRLSNRDKANPSYLKRSSVTYGSKSATNTFQQLTEEDDGAIPLKDATQARESDASTPTLESRLESRSKAPNYREW